MRTIAKIRNLYIIGAINATLLTAIILSYFYLKGKLIEIGLGVEFDKGDLINYFISSLLGVFLFYIDKLFLKIESIFIKRWTKESNYERFFYKYGFKNLLEIYSSFCFLIGMLFFSFWEELLFRGVGIYLFTILNFSKISGILITSFLFGIYHVFTSKASILPKFLGGFLLGVLFIFTMDLICVFLSHSIWNILIWREWRKVYLLNSKEFGKIPEGGRN